MRIRRLAAAAATVAAGALVLSACAAPQSEIVEGSSLSVAWNQPFYSVNQWSQSGNNLVNANIGYLINDQITFYDKALNLVNNKSFGTYDEDMRRYIERFESWAETHRQMKKVIDDFERIAERLGRRINEVAEMQRLSEGRFRQEWNDWIADDQKRWKQFTLTNDEAWRNHDKQLDLFRQSVEAVQAALDPLKNSIDRMWQLERARALLHDLQHVPQRRWLCACGEMVEGGFEQCWNCAALMPR